jgi:hypothetical protein
MVLFLHSIAKEEVAALLEQMKTLEGRAQQAENAKIEMSLVLAQLDEGANMSKPISGLPVGARAELLQEVSVKACPSLSPIPNEKS